MQHELQMKEMQLMKLVKENNELKEDACNKDYKLK